MELSAVEVGACSWEIGGGNEDRIGEAGAGVVCFHCFECQICFLGQRSGKNGREIKRWYSTYNASRCIVSVVSQMEMSHPCEYRTLEYYLEFLV